MERRWMGGSRDYKWKWNPILWNNKYPCIFLPFPFSGWGATRYYSVNWKGRMKIRLDNERLLGILLTLANSIRGGEDAFRNFSSLLTIRRDPIASTCKCIHLNRYKCKGNQSHAWMEKKRAAHHQLTAKVLWSTWNCGGQVFEKKSILTNNAELVGNSVAVEKRQLLGE